MSEPARRVTVVDDHSLFAETLVIALRGDGLSARRVLVDPATTHESLRRAIGEEPADVLLLDLELGIDVDVMQLLGDLSGSGVTVVVVTGTVDAARQGQALAQGAVAVLVKTQSFVEIRAAVHAIGRGLPAMPGAERQRLLAAYREADATGRELRGKFDRLSGREAEVLGLLVTGMQVAEIAATRVVSISTVRTQVKAVLSKLEVGSQLAAVTLAHQTGWRPPPGHMVGRGAEPHPA